MQHRIGNGVFYVGDCFDVMRSLSDGAADMVLCDLPYGTTRNKWDSILPLEELWVQYWRLCRGAIVLTAAQPFTSFLVMSQLKSFKYDWVWDKVKGVGFLNAKKMPMRNHESVLVFGKSRIPYHPQKTTGHERKTTYRGAHLQTDSYGFMKGDYHYSSTERYPRSIQVFSTDTQNSSLHPTQKPVALFEYLIRTYTNEDDLVLDNCAGSGTTAIAAENAGRRWICIEKDPEYAAKAVERICRHVDGW